MVYRAVKIGAKASRLARQARSYSMMRAVSSATSGPSMLARKPGSRTKPRCSGRGDRTVRETLRKASPNRCNLPSHPRPAQGPNKGFTLRGGGEKQIRFNSFDGWPMQPRPFQISTRNPTSMTASCGILKKSGARLAIRLRNEKIAKDIGPIAEPTSRRTMVSWAR